MNMEQLKKYILSILIDNADKLAIAPELTIDRLFDRLSVRHPSISMASRTLKQLIPMLTDRQQYIINEHYFKNKPITTIAKELGCKPHTAKTDLDHSLLMLRNSMLR